MPRFLPALVAVFLLAGCLNDTKAETFLAGDSHCVGLAQAAKLKSVARVGASTREVVSQLKQMPEGATVILCAGTNDAPNRLNGFQASVDAVLREAERRNQRLIWIGPINTPLWWDRYSAEAEKYLQSKISSFVSMRLSWKAGEHDGQFHLTPQGRKRLWSIVKGMI